jgi:hypothetical protein
MTIPYMEDDNTLHGEMTIPYMERWQYLTWRMTIPYMERWQYLTWRDENICKLPYYLKDMNTSINCLTNIHTIYNIT